MNKFLDAYCESWPLVAGVTITVGIVVIPFIMALIACELLREAFRRLWWMS
jgi:hypothetical protein